MSATNDPLLAHIEANPKYALLKRKRNSLGIILTIAMLVAYYGFMMVVAFRPAMLHAPLAEGSALTVGMPNKSSAKPAPKRAALTTNR